MVPVDDLVPWCGPVLVLQGEEEHECEEDAEGRGKMPDVMVVENSYLALVIQAPKVQEHKCNAS